MRSLKLKRAFKIGRAKQGTTTGGRGPEERDLGIVLKNGMRRGLINGGGLGDTLRAPSLGEKKGELATGKCAFWVCV